MLIERVLVIPARGGYFNEDLAAIRAGSVKDGFIYVGEPVSPGFDRIKEPSEAASVILLLDNGLAVSGDALSVEFSAAGGRQGRFRASDQVDRIRTFCRSLEGQRLGDFIQMCEALEQRADDDALHVPAAMYAVSQALLQAIAVAERRTCAEVLADGLGTTVSSSMIPINVQSGEERHVNVDKAILKRADVLPHGLINDIERCIGRDGEILVEYVTWVIERIRKFGSDGYRPEIHLDVYGLPGAIFANDATRVADYLARLAEIVDPLHLCVETPVLMNSRDEQIDAYRSIRARLNTLGSPVSIVIDEWANNIDDIREFIAADATHMVNVKSPDLGSFANAGKAILECWDAGVRPILGGSCTDTDQSARIAAHVALATQPAWVLARPGMGVDEGLQIVENEMARTLAIIEARREGTSGAGSVQDPAAADSTLVS